MFLIFKLVAVTATRLTLTIGFTNFQSALFSTKFWHPISNNPSSKPMMIQFMAQICITRPRWVNSQWPRDTIWCHTLESSSVEVMVCHLCGVKPSAITSTNADFLSLNWCRTAMSSHADIYHMVAADTPLVVVVELCLEDSLVERTKTSMQAQKVSKVNGNHWSKSLCGSHHFRAGCEHH